MIANITTAEEVEVKGIVAAGEESYNCKYEQKEEEMGEFNH
jgi:hypothetical protein